MRKPFKYAKNIQEIHAQSFDLGEKLAIGDFDPLDIGEYPRIKVLLKAMLVINPEVRCTMEIVGDFLT